MLEPRMSDNWAVNPHLVGSASDRSEMPWDILTALPLCALSVMGIFSGSGQTISQRQARHETAMVQPAEHRHPHEQVRQFLIQNNSKQNITERSALKIELRNFGTYEADWDGEGAYEANKNAISDAIAFINNIPHEIKPPRPMLERDGSISLYWRSTKAKVIVRFLGTEDFAWFAKNIGTGITDYGDNDLIKDVNRQSRLINFLREVDFVNERPARS